LFYILISFASPFLFEVSPFYDPMLSKIISYAPTRDEAIDILADGLDNYVIEGVQHNARLVNAVLRHPVFRSGNTPTSFLPKHIPKFGGVELKPSQEEELAVAVALISKERESMLQRPPVTAGSDSAMVVRLGGLFGKAFSVKLHDSTTAVVACLSEEGAASERQVAIDSVRLDPDNYMAHLSLDGSARSIQVCCLYIR
jgi:acetyl/propionyl-CoA carboxylase alpha subunit